MIFRVKINSDNFSFKKSIHARTMESLWLFVSHQIEINCLQDTNLRISIEIERRYEEYVDLIKKGWSKKDIQQKLNLSYLTINNYEKYYRSENLKLNMSTYNTLKKAGHSDEYIRQLYNIPITEFSYFINTSNH